jgi:hypothetical protein
MVRLLVRTAHPVGRFHESDTNVKQPPGHESDLMHDPELSRSVAFVSPLTAYAIHRSDPETRP